MSNNHIALGDGESKADGYKPSVLSELFTTKEDQ